MNQNEENYNEIDDALDELDDTEEVETDLEIDDNVDVNLVRVEVGKEERDEK